MRFYYTMNDNKQHVFDKELNTLNHAKTVLERESISAEDIQAEYKDLTENYQQLLADTRVITNISDRLQNKLNITNDKLQNANDTLEANSKEIEEKNEELKAINDEVEKKNQLLQSTNETLQNTIDELTKARISRQAATIVLMAAILLFIISELFLEPIVDKYFKDNFLISVAIKGSIALLLRPIDYLLEGYLQRLAVQKSTKAMEASS